MKLKLLPRFMISLIILGVVLTLSISMFSYFSSKDYFENMYAERVLIGSKTIAGMLSSEDVKTVISEKGDKTDAYEKLYCMLNKMKEENQVTFLSLVVPDEDSVTFYIDTYVESMGDDREAQLPYGADILYTDAANDEDDLQNYYIIWDYYAKNEAPPTPLVTDNSYGYNYTAVCPVLDENGNAIAEIQYILDMQDVRNHLTSFLYTMLGISFAIILLAILCYILFVRRTVTYPLGRLAQFTRDITKNSDFHGKSIAVNTGDEIEELGNAFNYMLEELDHYVIHLGRVTAEKERIGAELDVAARIQADMLPCIFPAFPDRHEFDIYASMTPAKEVGGDFYDFFLVDHDHLAIVMADVSGKGVPAALFMMISKTLIKSAAQTGLSPKDVLEKVNNQLCENNEAEMFVTVWLGVLEISTGRMICANAGHEYPAVRRKDGSFELFKDKHGFVLAGMENVKYREYELILEPGDSVFVYTDGVPEATNAQNELFGTDRMLAALNKEEYAGCEGLLSAVHREIDTFAGCVPQFDDITMLCLKMSGGDWISLKPSADTMGQVTEFVENKLKEYGVPLNIIMKMNIAVDEIYSNIIRYSGADEVSVECSVTGSRIVLTFMDNGEAYNPLEQDEPDITLSADDRQVGGLGIFMVKKTMDEVDYRYENSRNILILRKSYGAKINA